MKHARWMALAAAIVSPALPAAAEYPEKPIEVIMPWPAGVASDVAARVVVQQMAEELGAPMQIIAKPGGSGVLGTMELVNARPDGYTVGTITVGPAVTQVLMGNTPYQMQDMEPVGLFMTLPFLLLAGKDAPYDDIAGLTEYASANEVTLGHYGLAAVPTLAFHRIAQARGFGFKEVTFNPPNSSQLSSGDADIVTVTIESARGAIESGDAKPIVAMTPGRMSSLPDLATVREQGDEFDVGVWTGLFVPVGAPPEVKARLAEALKAALATPEVAEYAEASGTIFAFTGAEEAKALIAQDAKAYDDIMQKLGLK